MTTVPIRIGDLRQRLMLDAPVETPDGQGGVTRAWGLVAEVWGAVLPRSGGEGEDAARFAGRVAHIVWLRHRPGVVPGMRVRLGPRVFEIASVIDIDERHRWLKLDVVERNL